MDTLEVVLHESDFILAQEVARSEAGWNERNDDLFFWLLHRHEHQYRGVGIGIAQDLLDCVIDKAATERGIWALVRIKGIGRVVIGSLHCHTGATQRVYATAVQDYFKSFKKKWKGYPIILGADVNEQPVWSRQENDEFNIVRTTVNLEAMLEETKKAGLKPITPEDHQLSVPTHYPRDITREGRQIDMIFVKALSTSRGRIRPGLRHCIGTDHAEMNLDILSSGTRFQPWGNDTRPRRLSNYLPEDDVLVDSTDLQKLARQCTCPKSSASYKDTEEIKTLIAHARQEDDPAVWKQVHKLRRKARKAWTRDRAAAILSGDWSAFRAYQRDRKRRKGWWGRMLEDRSAVQLTSEVQMHLEAKMSDKNKPNWGDSLDKILHSIELPIDWVPFTKEEIFETLSQMRPHTAVGKDLICVDLLKAIVLHDTLGEQFVSLTNHIVKHNQQPQEWNVSVLALLAKCAEPRAPGDLRPICVGSNFAKMTNRLVMGRLFPLLRRGSRSSACGKGRQVADLIGVMTRLRDMAHEWREPLLVAKLDISGAFDRLDRDAVIRLLLDRTRHTSMGHEVRYFVQQLEVHHLEGVVPGGGSIAVQANVGIRQGAPESAELFGLAMGLFIDEAMDSLGWKQVGAPIDDLDIELLYFQDDIFLFESSTARLARKVAIVGEHLRKGGLHLAMNKTKIVATPDYKGKMTVDIGGQAVEVQTDASIRVLGVSFNFAGPPAQQAEELLGRARAAYEEHRPLLLAKGSWKSKAYMVSMLIASTWRWAAGSVHWHKECLSKANSLQSQILRTSFKIGREQGEDWVTWNKRSLRTVRTFLHRHQFPRWSTIALTMQHQLMGHWARQTETLQDGSLIPGITMRSLLWRNQTWWERQKSLTTGRRHPRAFFPSNMERLISSALGNNWYHQAADRVKWKESLSSFLDKCDVTWASGRQSAIAN